MDRLDALLHWGSDLDRPAQMEVIWKVIAIAPIGFIHLSGLVNDPAQSPFLVAFGDLAKLANDPMRREGLFVALVAWLDVVMVEGPTGREIDLQAPIQAASHSAKPVTSDVIARGMASRMVGAANAAMYWSKAVRSWKEFRHGPT